MTFLIFLSGWLPFVNLYRLEPIPSFWVQWLAVVLALLWVVVASIRWRSLEWRELTGPAITLLGLVIGLLAQIKLGMVLDRVNAGFALVILVSGFLFHQVARCQLPVDERAKVLKAWAWGVFAAGLCEGVVSILGTQGLTIVINQLYVVDVPERQFGAFGQPNQFGVFAVLFLASSVYLARVRAMPVSLLVPAWILGSWMCAASGSRAALCLWMLTLALHALDWRRGRENGEWPRMVRGAGLWSLHALFVAMQLAWATRYTWLMQPAATAVEVHEGRLLRAQSFSYRFELFRDAWQLFLDKPVFGHGFDQFASARFHLLSKHMVEPHALNTHNLLTNVMVEFGGVGLLVMLVGVVWVTLGGLKEIRGSGVVSAESGVSDFLCVRRFSPEVSFSEPA